MKFGRPVRFASLDEADRRARRRLPPTLYRRINVGGGGDRTNVLNMKAFDALTFRPRAATVHERRALGVRVLGHDLRLPVLLAPTGGIRLVHPDGECGAARAAGRAGTAYAVSMFAGYTIEEIAAAATGPLFQQLYMRFGRAIAEETIDRAAAAGYGALVVTVDVPVLPHSAERPLKADLYNALRYGPEIVRRPGWFYRFARDGMPFGVASAVRAASDSATAVMGASWADLGWIRDRWRGPIIIKGIVSGDDALRAVDAGADAVVVSNHGGKGLDGVRPTLRALPEVVKAVQGSAEILLDGGIRSGADVVKAIALGAKAVLIGRPYIWGLAAGEQGVSAVLELLADEIDRTLALLGCPGVGELDETFIDTMGVAP